MMDYERIHANPHPQGGGGLSPRKLRSMLLGVEKKRKDEEEIESVSNSRSQLSDVYPTGGDSNFDCKDLDVMIVQEECSGSIISDSTSSSKSHRRNKDAISRTRSYEDSSSDHDSKHDCVSVSSPMFEFQKAERAPPKMPIAPFSKPAPSKWDDAQKWVASPNSNRSKSRHGQVGIGGLMKKASNFGYGSRQSSMKIVSEVPDQKLVTYEEPDTKRMNSSQNKKQASDQRVVGWEDVSYPFADSYSKTIESTQAESAISLSRHDSAVSVHSASTFIPVPSTARSVSMRDMGTEMTPIASQEPSRTGTPVRATTPIRSPTSSRPSSPGRTAPTTSPAGLGHLDLNSRELSEKELQMKTRREIVALGKQLGKMNIAAWASKEEEDKDASTLLKMKAAEQQAKSVIEARAAAWEEAEKAKYMARFKREEIKIEAWENHQKAKSEAEMRKIEVEVERVRGRAQDKLMNKLATARHKAEEKRAAAEAQRDREGAKTEQQAEYIRRTGRIPSSFSFCSWCS